MEQYQMDLLPDDENNIQKAKSVMRWDAKKKKYLPCMVAVDGKVVKKVRKMKLQLLLDRNLSTICGMSCLKQYDKALYGGPQQEYKRVQKRPLSNVRSRELSCATAFESSFEGATQRAKQTSKQKKPKQKILLPDSLGGDSSVEIVRKLSNHRSMVRHQQPLFHTEQDPILSQP